MMMTLNLLRAALWRAIVFVALAAGSTGVGAQLLPNSQSKTEQVQVRLLAYAPQGILPGQPVWVGLQLTHQPEWHTYWKNAGDSGLPTRLEWTLPPGVEAGDIAWPTPRKLRIANLANYGYEGTVLLPVPLTITPAFQPSLTGALEIRLNAHWLVCRTECVPQDATLGLSVPARGSTALDGPLFEAAWAAQPKPLQAADSLAEPGVDGLQVRVDALPEDWRNQTLEFYPETPEIIAPAAVWTQRWDGTQWQASVPLSPDRSATPATLPVVLALGNQSVRVTLPVRGTWPAPGTVKAAAVAAPTPLPGSTAPPLTGWLWALVGAFVGGLLLNLMPCVFPVLAIKVLGFTRHAHETRLRRLHGLAYSAGVVLSFVALGALMLGLRSAGEQLGWGFQLQSPLVVAALAVLFTLMGLNLAGLFEFGQMLPERLVLAQARSPALDAALSGVLAVAIASPCTAPFMGAALGLALTLPAAQALAVFAAIGAGMALPYLAAATLPGVAQRLPRPGPWMDHLRQFMAFPMFATVIWLVWVLGQQTGIDGVGALLVLLLALALMVWALTRRSPMRAWFAIISIAVTAGLTVVLGPLVLKPATHTSAGSELWQPWSQAAVQQAQARGQPVFVDFTAAWCVTCQVNKQTTLTDAGVLADLRGRKVLLLRADWTRRDADITAALAALGRNGVPVYVLYAPGRAPQLLPEVLSPGLVHDALATLGPRPP